MGKLRNCKVGLHYRSAPINQLFNTKNSFQKLSYLIAILKCGVLFESVFFTSFFHKIVWGNVKSTQEILNLDSKMKHLFYSIEKTSKSCPDAGLISKAVKTYFDWKVVKTRLKPVKTGLNRSKCGQNLKLRKMCQGLWKNPVRWIYIWPSMYGLCIWNALNFKI